MELDAGVFEFLDRLTQRRLRIASDDLTRCFHRADGFFEGVAVIRGGSIGQLLQRCSQVSTCRLETISVRRGGFDRSDFYVGDNWRKNAMDKSISSVLSFKDAVEGWTEIRVVYLCDELDEIVNLVPSTSEKVF
jgi:hypothetical protein